MKIQDTKQGLIKNIFSLSLVQLANNILPLVTIPYLVRIIGPEKFGAINFVSAIIMYFTLFVQYSFDLTATRKIATNKNNISERSKIFSDVLFAKALLLLCSLIIFIILLYSLPQLSTEKPLAIYSFIYCFSLILTPNWLFQGMQELHQIALCNFIAKLSFTIFLFLLIKSKQDYVLQPLIFSISTILVGIFAIIFSLKKYQIKIIKVKISDILLLLWEGKTVFLSIILLNLYTTANLIIIGFVQNNHAVAIYSASWKLIVAVQALISLPLSLSLFPFIGESFGISKLKGLQKIKQITPLIISFTFFTGVILWLISPWIIKIFYGQGFSDSIKVFRILCFIPMISSLNNILGIQTMINLKMDKLYFLLTLLAALFGIGLSIILSMNFGYIGTSWAWLLTEIFNVLILWLLLYSKKIQIIDRSLFNYRHFQQASIPLIALIKTKLFK